MKDEFWINDVSSETLGIYVDTPPIPPMPNRRLDTYQNGGDEDAHFKLENFDNIKYTLTFYRMLKGRDNNDSDLHAFLANAQTFKVSRLEGCYYKVVSTALGSETELNGDKIRYTLELTLSPFRYKDSSAEITLSNGGTVTNTGTRYAKPVFTVLGKGDIILTVNGESFSVPNVTDICIIDSVRKVTYSANTLIFNTKGKYPFFAVGSNTVSWSGNISSVSVKINERSY